MLRFPQTSGDTTIFEIDIELGIHDHSISEDVRVVIPSRKFKKIPVHVALDAISDSENDNENEIKCLICQHHVVKLQKYTVLPVCHHLFHRKCIKKWLCKYRAQCPHCRQEVIGGKPMLRNRALSIENSSNMQLTVFSTPSAHGAQGAQRAFNILRTNTQHLYNMYSLPMEDFLSSNQTFSNSDILHDVMVFITSALSQSDEDLFLLDDTLSHQQDGEETNLSIDLVDIPHVSQGIMDVATRDTETENNDANITNQQNNPENL
jgi:hypothetical protein